MIHWKIKKAFEWANTNSVSYFEALTILGFKEKSEGLDNKTIEDANKLALKSSVIMGGSAHIHLIYDCVRLLRAKKAIETGVAYGWSSLAILKALKKIMVLFSALICPIL